MLGGCCCGCWPGNSLQSGQLCFGLVLSSGLRGEIPPRMARLLVRAEKVELLNIAYTGKSSSHLRMNRDIVVSYIFFLPLGP